jgi:transitional endoplasmic reticulum ATPase
MRKTTRLQTPKRGARPASATAPQSQLAVWILRLLMGVRGLRPMKLAEIDEDVYAVAGIENPGRRGPDAGWARERCRLRLAKAICEPPDRSSPVFVNAALLGKCFGLSEMEQEILAFAVMAHAEPALSDCLDAYHPRTVRAFATLVARCIEVEPTAVRAALRTGATLASAGLIRFTTSHFGERAGFELVDTLKTLAFNENADAETVLAAFFSAARPALLSLSDFPHVARDVDLMVRYLGNAVERRSAGVNVLVYGPPGTGKTELARAIASALGVRTYEVGADDDDGDAVQDEARLDRFRLCQRLLRNAERAIVLFDEVEDVFLQKGLGVLAKLHDTSENKAHRISVLETNPVPAIWIANSVGLVDNAILRRFDYVLELRTPPPSVRSGIIERYTAGLPVTREFIATAAHDERLTPGHIERATKVARAIGDTTPEKVQAAIMRVLDNTLAAQGASPRRSIPSTPCAYDPTYVNASTDLTKVIAGLQARRSGNLCLYGPSGTGKTAFVDHMGAALDLPVMKRRASDMLSMWVGGTEQNISRMFRDAQAAGAILLLDEADSFLQERGRAQQTFEITQVNELLVQAECFGGIFACTTNLMDTVDRAALRRFEIKIRFDALKRDQRVRMLVATLAQIGVPPLEGADLDRAVRDLAALGTLTPGDFAAVARQIGITASGGVRARDVIAALAEECRLKPDQGKRVVGFGAPRDEPPRDHERKDDEKKDT